jgi:hypothetical protein
MGGGGTVFNIKKWLLQVDMIYENVKLYFIHFSKLI